ncbi:helix-turn-helix domain-containing protein [Microbulbifer pacificus]|uniref:AraC family transcriptional regulator N-terminal domain-containing protein n=1 Tax=Microbulbifer pacificus TaxID=407164 RepID=A0AAU0MWN5_9GAMM|nr:helix-turn-helix domain-containing protein [Microbulbifer pacificus]WOX04420.1 AraC family transcriptional regulator N-terminal domain-containing protein [Microbulbifer pacificus]
MTEMTIRGRAQPRELVENRVSFAGPSSELSVYDTYLPAERVGLSAGELLYCGMISGRKIMHAAGNYSAEFVPRESFVMAPGEKVHIDFPDARLENPTSCLTIEIARERVGAICEKLNAAAPLQREFDDWRYRPDSLIHTQHSQATQALLQRLVTTFTENSSDRDFLVDLGVSELVVRMLREQMRSFLLKVCEKNPEVNGLAAALNQLQSKLDQSLDIDQLSRMACMSRTRFYNEFKKHLGCTPAEFQQHLRMQAARDRLARGESVTRVCFDLGYRHLSHFSRRFHQQFGVSPKQYRDACEVEVRR